MEPNIRIYSIVVTLSIFVFALIAVVEMPSTFENVLTQQPEGSQQYSSSSSSQQRSTEDSLRDLDRSIEQSEVEYLDRTPKFE
jgi:hypothetical protein